MKTDFSVQETGSNFVVVHPNTDAAKEWIADHVGDEAQWWAGGVVVEHRYLDDLIAGIYEDGFTVG